MSTIVTMISLGVISAILMGLGWLTGVYPKTENFAMAFAVYAAIQANKAQM